MQHQQQGQVPVRVQRALSTATDEGGASAINWIAIARRVGRSVIAWLGGGAGSAWLSR